MQVVAVVAVMHELRPRLSAVPQRHWCRQRQQRRRSDDAQLPHGAPPLTKSSTLCVRLLVT
jgi:hypothetical protein